MIDGETGERTIDTLVKSQDEVREKEHAAEHRSSSHTAGSSELSETITRDL